MCTKEEPGGSEGAKKKGCPALPCPGCGEGLQGWVSQGAARSGLKPALSLIP